jgi:alginate O-acetyltransferase complex protein AlgI
MFGYDFGENFNFPYIAKDIRDFWRRWHISLSGWLRDYLFLPMAYLLSRNLPANRYLFLKTDHIIYSVGITITFFICGLWHGATANFIVWGLYFALFLMVEQLFLGRLLKKLWTPVRHFYTLLVVVCSWVIFRSDNLSDAGRYFEKMFVYSNGSEAVTSYLKFFIFSWETLTMLVFAILFATPVYSYVRSYVLSMYKLTPLVRIGVHTTAVLMLGALLIISLSYLTVKTYEPFIYFRF